MSFVIEKKIFESVKRFVNPNGAIQTVWDIYYLGLLLGFAHGSSQKINERHDFIKKFTKDYESQQWNIITLMLVTHAENFGIKLNEREEIMSLVRKLFDSNSYSKLSENYAEISSDQKNGIDLLNDFANKGINLINDHIGFAGEPHHFLMSYYKLLKKTISDRKL